MEKRLITKEKEEYYKSKGLVNISEHPTLDLKIINYSPKVVYENLWDENLLSYRGLVYNSKYEIISRGFVRFFNIEENRHEPTDDFEVFEKLDGQYIGCFWYNGEMVVNSKGSFTSPYAVEAKRILKEKYPHFSHISFQGLSYCFELIGFEQIVVSYPEVDLILTGIFNKFGTDWFCELSDEFCVPIVKKFNGPDWKNIKHLNWQNSEGFVVRFSNGSRCKIKFEDYLKLHRQMTNLSTTAIWEALMNGEPVSTILNDVPDEFYDKVNTWEVYFTNQYNRLRFLHEIVFAAFEHKGYVNNRKLFAKEVSSVCHPNLPTNSAILFAMLDGKDYSKIIWKSIKPEFQKI